MVPKPPLTVNWDGFEKFVHRVYPNKKTAWGRLKYAKDFHDCLLSYNYDRLLEVSDDKRCHVLRALSCLAKFLGVYEEFRKSIKNYGLKWRGKSADDIIIGRLIKVNKPDEVFDWVKEVKRRNSDLCTFMDLLATTGLRFGEAVESYNLIAQLAMEGRLSEYFDERRGVLEHFKFKNHFLKCSKKAFISFVSKELVQAVTEETCLNYAFIQTRVKRRIRRLRFSDVREAFATFMTKYLTQPEIDFLQGRVSTSVFMRNYFNPALISDLKERALKGAEEILNSIAIG